MTKLFDEIDTLLRRIIREEISIAIADSGHKAIVPTAVEVDWGMPTALLTANEVAMVLSVSVQRVYELARRSRVNGFPVIKLGERQYRFDRRAIHEWMHNRSNSSAAFADKT